MSNTQDSKKISSSEPDEVVELMRFELKRAGIETEAMSDDEVRGGYARLRTDRDAAGKAALERQQHEREADRHRRQLDRRNVDTAGMTPDQMRARAEALKKEDAEAKQETLRIKAEARRRDFARTLFADAECPPHHAEALSRLDPDQKKWQATRDKIFRRIRQHEAVLIPLLGPRGTGKTEMGVSLIALASLELFSSRYITMSEFFDELQAAFVQVAKGEEGTSIADVIDEFAAFDLLVIDELQVANESGFRQENFVKLIDRRYRSDKATIWIANLDKDQFIKLVGASTVSRIHECGEVIVCDWPSFRRPGTWLERDSKPRAPRTPPGNLDDDSIDFDDQLP
jgi:DNA replication protein DnaC